MVSFEVLEPAEISFPEDVSQFLVMHRLPAAHMLLDTVTLSTFGRKDFDGMDTLIAFNIYRGLYNRLRQSPVYSHRWPNWAFEIQSDILASGEVRLNKREVAGLCREYAADVIICLESCRLNFRLEDTAWIRGEVYEPHYRGSLSSHWVVYLPDHPRPFKELDIWDTIDHRLDRWSLNAFELVRRTALQNGRRFGEKVTPHWQQTSRAIYSGTHPDLYKASMETREGNWDSAFERWKKMSGSGSKHKRARAMYNMAVFYELEDRLDSAAALLEQAVALTDDSLVHTYCHEMHRRLEKQDSVYRQVEAASPY